jgi:C4-dicarboxylate transporter, DctM subunit
VIEAILGFIAIFALALLRVPLAFGMGVVGIVGIAYTRGWQPAIASTAQVVYETGFAYTLSVIPLFILMGNFVAKAGLAHELFRAAYAFIGHLRGGLAHATVIACAGFGAICGSSIATAATMSKVAYPSMKKLGYSDSLSTGVIASGGTLGIMIPPSTIMVIYGIVTETHIGKLFAAGVLPGLLTAALLMVAILIMTTLDPEHAPAGEKSSWKDRFTALRGIWGVLLLVIVVLGGIYGGVFTATEGAGIGASGAFLFALARRALTVKSTIEVLIESARTTAVHPADCRHGVCQLRQLHHHARRSERLDHRTGLLTRDDCGRDDADLHHFGHGDGRAHHGAAHHPPVLPDRHGAWL